ncbi:MAG TPA: NADH-specific enoyl-ACP reductase [Dehalococcoidia bacterium]|nr:NADH-specific enoyl-ACP reductase [Dehalococcoidia bacterium]
MLNLKGKKGVVFGVANDKSIAWAISDQLSKAGARLALTYQNERLESRVQKLAQNLDNPLLVQCDASSDLELSNAFEVIAKEFGDISFVIHSIAFANKEDLSGRFTDTTREGFQTALDISTYTLLPITKLATPLMTNGGSIIVMTFDASRGVYPGYNVMGTAKAALEHSVRQLAYEHGPAKIRVNAISAGPLDTLAARGISGFLDMKKIHADRSPLKRNITAEEVANTATFLASDLATGITGAIIPVDAGFHIMAV